MGKTSLAINIGEHVAIDLGMPVAVFSLEMGAAQLALRMLGSIGRIDQMRLRTGRLNPDDWTRLSSAIERMPKPTRIGLRRIGLMSASSSGENRATEISEISRSLKALAKELKVPVIALSQLNRTVEQRTDKRPVMSDLRESGAIEQDADLILFIYRDEVYNPESADKGIAEIIIGKQRNGPIGRVNLRFGGEHTRFDNLAPGSQSHSF